MHKLDYKPRVRNTWRTSTVDKLKHLPKDIAVDTVNWHRELGDQFKNGVYILCKNIAQLGHG